MNLLLHFFRKDLRLIRWLLLLLILGTVGFVLWFSMLPLDGRAPQIEMLSLGRYLVWAACFLMIGGLIQGDAPFREAAFFRTRPVNLSTLIHSKFLTALFVIVPFAVIGSLSLLMLGLKPGAPDLLLIFTEELLVLSALAAVSMALSLQQESIGKYLTSLAGLGFALFIGWIAYAWIRQWYDNHHERPEWSYDGEYLKTSRLLATQFVALAGPVTGIVLFARGGRRETISKALALTAVCSITAWLFWPLNFVKAFAPAPREAPESEWPDPSKLKFAFEKQRTGPDGESLFTFSDEMVNDTRYRQVQGYSRLTGLTGGWRAAHHNSYQSVLNLSNGKSFSKHSKAWAGLEPEVILPLLGIPNHIIGVDKLVYQFELAKFNLQQATGVMDGAKLKGTVRIHFKRPVLLGRIPLENGASACIEGRLVTITQVANSGDEIDCRFSVRTHMVKLCGGWQKIWADRFEYVIINAGRREFLRRRSGGQANRQAGHFSFQTEDFTGSIWNESYSKKPLAPDWLNGAELLIVAEENGGSLFQDFDFKNINLGNER